MDNNRGKVYDNEIEYVFGSQQRRTAERFK